MRLVWLMIVLLLLGSACSNNTPPAETLGGWKIDMSDIPVEFLLDGRAAVDGTLLLSISVHELSGATRFVVGFLRCSDFGGEVSDIDPLTSTFTSVAGVGGCSEEDRLALEFLVRIEGSSITYDSLSD